MSGEPSVLSSRPEREELEPGGETAATTRTPAGSGVSVSVIIPTFNERENISAVIAGCLKALPPDRFDAEVLVVDDDSEDYTWQYPSRLFSHDARVRVLRREDKQSGLARSVVDGFSAARGEYCAVIDADLQHPPSKLPALFDALEDGADIAIGSRHTDEGGIENWPAWRKVVSSGATACARVALPDCRSVADPMSGFFAIRRRVVDGVDLNPRGYKILLEVLGKGNYDTITEVPYVFRERERGESKLTASEYQNFLEHLGRLAIDSRGVDVVAPTRAVRGAEFAAVGAVGTVVNMAVFSALALGADVFFLGAGVVAFLAAVNWNFAGNWLLTYDRPEGDIVRQYALFHAVSVAGFLAYSGTLTLSAFLGVPILAANLLAILAGSGVNFFGSETSVFDPVSSDTAVSRQRPNTADD